MMFPKPILSPVHFLEFLEPFTAMGDSHRAVQHDESLTRKNGIRLQATVRSAL